MKLSRTSGDRNFLSKSKEISCEVLFIAKNTADLMKIHFTTASRGDKIGKLECGRDPQSVDRNAPLRNLRAQQFNNLIVRKFFKDKLTAVICNNGYYQLLVKSMHKKVLKGT